MTSLFLSLFFITVPWSEIEKFYSENIKTIYAEFKEVLISDGEKTEYEGKVWAKRNGYLKFLIEKPDSQLLFVRKDKVYLYDFDERKETEIFSSPYLPDFFLFNFENLYVLKEEKKKGDTLNFIFERKDTNLIYDTIKTYFPVNDKKPYKIDIISSSLSVEYKIIFKKFVINPFLREEIFKKVQSRKKTKDKKNGRSH